MPHESREDYSESSESDLNLAKASLEIADQFEERNVPFPVTSVGYLAALSVEKKLKATLMGIYGAVSQTHDLKKLFWELPNDLQTDELRFGLEELRCSAIIRGGEGPPIGVRRRSFLSDSPVDAVETVFK